MRRNFFLCIIVLTGLTPLFPVIAQVAPEIREKLVTQNVVISSGYLYALAAGAIRGTIETSEQLQVTRAMRNIAHALCEFQPFPGKRLETEITGTTLLTSTTRSKEIEVIVRVPLQKPVCKVRLLAAPPDTAAPSATLSQRPEEESRTQLTDTGYSRSQDIVIRIFGGEY